MQVLPDSLSVCQLVPGSKVYIDADTVAHLELVHSSSRDGSLLGLLNKTVTKGGAQLLKATLLQPVCSVATIDARLDALDEILRDETLYVALKSLLSKVPKVRTSAALRSALPWTELPRLFFAASPGPVTSDCTVRPAKET